MRAGSGLAAAYHALLSVSDGCLPRLREDIVGQLADGAGQDRLGLGAEGGQLLGVLRRSGSFCSPSQRTARSKQLAGFFAVSQPVVGHGQEEEVEGVGLAAAGGQASLQGRDGLGVPARAVLDDAQRVEVDGLRQEPGPRRGGPARARGRGRAAARDRWPAPRPGCCSRGPAFSDSGLVRV